MAVLIMILSSVAIIAIVKYGLVEGLDRVSLALRWTPKARGQATGYATSCLLYTSPSPRDATLSRMPSSA